MDEFSLSNFQVRHLLIMFYTLRNWEFVGEGLFGGCGESILLVLKLNEARGILVVVEIRRLEFGYAIMDTCLYFSSATLYSSVFSII